MTGATLRERAYRHIQAKILTGALRPGQRISEQTLAAEIGISRTPVRSAIRELESEGLLQQVPRFGTIVRETNRRDLAELFDLRLALEGFAAEVAAERMDRDDLQELIALCDEMDELLVDLQHDPARLRDAECAARFVDSDMRFHVAILRATGNRRLMKSVADSRMLSDWGRFAATHRQGAADVDQSVSSVPRAATSHHRPATSDSAELETLRIAWEHHRRIVAAMQDQDGTAARDAMIHHVRFSKELALYRHDRSKAAGEAEAILQRAQPLFIRSEGWEVPSDRV